MQFLAGTLASTVSSLVPKENGDMIPEQREALDDLIVKMRAGRMTRRTFMERAVAIGLTSTVAGSLLEACGGGGSTNSGPTTIVWQTENDNSGTYPAIVDNYNKTNRIMSMLSGTTVHPTPL